MEHHQSDGCEYEITDGKYFQCTHPKCKHPKNEWFSISCAKHLVFMKCSYLEKKKTDGGK